MATQKRKSLNQANYDVAPLPQFSEPEAEVFLDGPVCPPRINGQPTVNGKPLPEHFAHAIPFANTDQGKWEANQKADCKPSGIWVGAEPLDKAMDQRVDQPWAQVDPLKSAIDSIAQPGMKYRALSERVCDKRGLRGWDPVITKNGEKVKVGRLFLGRMPVEVANQRNEHYRRIGSDDLKNVEESFVADQEKAIRDSGSRGVSALRHGDLLKDTRDPDRAATVGFGQRRGEEQAA